MDEAGHVRVVVRVRPLNQNELSNDSRSNLACDKKSKTVVITTDDSKKVFRFDDVFETDSTQLMVYNEAVNLLVENFLKGHNACVIAHGQTGTGKSYTTGMHASVVRNGIAHCLLRDIFDYVEGADDGEDAYQVSVSFLEICNEEVYDLLQDQRGRQSVTAREDGNGIKLPDLKEFIVGSFEDAMVYFTRGVGAHSTLPMQSSNCSHAVFSVDFEHRSSSGNGIIRAKLQLVDLAGSEMGVQQNTMVTKTPSKGGSSVNRSLLALGNALEAINRGRSFVSYRDSILTRLLQDSLGGKSILIACVCPTQSQSSATVAVLRFAERARAARKVANTPADSRRSVYYFPMPAKKASKPPTLCNRPGNKNKENVERHDLNFNMDPVGKLFADGFSSLDDRNREEETQASDRIALTTIEGSLSSGSKTSNETSGQMANTAEIVGRRRTLGVDPSLQERVKRDVLRVLNVGSETELQKLPFIGVQTAHAILSWREQHGEFQNVTELKRVDGIRNNIYSRFLKANFLS